MKKNTLKEQLESLNESKKINIWESYDRTFFSFGENVWTNAVKQVEQAMKDTLGHKRDMNAQINDIEYTMNHLMENWDAKKRRMKLKNIKSSQSEFSYEKINGMLSDGSYDPLNEVFFVSEDNRLLDGHHRWIAGKVIDENQYVDVIKVPLPFMKTRGILHKMKNTDKKGVNESSVNDSAVEFVSLQERLEQLRK